MNCPNCNGRTIEILNEAQGFAKGTRKCSTCKTVFTLEGKVLVEGQSFLSEVNPNSPVF